MFGSPRPACAAQYRSRQRLSVILLALTGMSAAGLSHSDQDSDSAQATPQVNVAMLDSASDACVVLVHGLVRTASSMDKMAEALTEAGYNVANVDYPSRKHLIGALSDAAIPAGVDACRKSGSHRIHMVTHSLGGILVRDYLDRHAIDELQRVIMLAPPNHGSAVVDHLKDVPGVTFLNGPTFEQLGTDAKSIPLQLGPPVVDTAVIAGSRSINLYLSTFLANPDDGKVSVASARLEGMCAMLVLGVSHPFIMKDEEAIAQTINYLENGRFTSAEAEYPDCEFRNPI